MRAVALRALTVGGGTSAGYTVPVALDPTLMLTSDGALNPIRDLAHVETINVSEWSGVATAGMSATWGTEGSGVADGSAALSGESLEPSICRLFTRFSTETGDAWGAFGQEMAKLFSDARDTTEAEKFAVGAGAGSNEPEGIITGASEVIERQVKAHSRLPTWKKSKRLWAHAGSHAHAGSAL